jgi:hypothetical protein
MKRVFLALFLAGLIACIVCIAWTSNVYAISDQAIMDRLDALQMSVEKQQQEIKHLRQQLEEQKAAAEKAKEREAIEIEKAVAEKVKEEVKLPGWLNRIKIKGDVRTRYEGIFSRKDGGQELKDRNRGRLRARLFFDAKISDEFTAHLGLCTNMDTKRGWKAKTANDDMTGYLSTKNFGLIRSYGEYKPKWLPGSKFGAGKYKLNFLYTDILWDPDCNPEGVYGYYKYQRHDVFQPFLYAAWNILDEQKNGSDSRLTIIQPGFDLKLGDVTWTLAGSLHDYVNLNEGETYVDSTTANQTMADLCTYGNSIYTDGTHDYYLYGFRLLEGITYLNFKFADIPVKLFFDYIENVADDVPSDHDTAISTGFKVGKNKKQGDLSLFFKYAKIEPDATLGIYNDSDFYGSNRKGTKTKLSYNAWDWLTLNAALFITEEEKDVENNGEDKETRFMMDFVAKF